MEDVSTEEGSLLTHSPRQATFDCGTLYPLQTLKDTSTNQRLTVGQRQRTHDKPWRKPHGIHDSDMPKHARKNYMKQIKLASWNVRTVSDVTTSKRQAPERRSALVAAELGRLDIDLPA